MIDICKKKISENRFDEAQVFHQQLSAIEFSWQDDFVETIKKQIIYLKPKIDPHFSIIHQADQLSKTGEHQQALTLISSMISAGQLATLHHESYGWIIYRCIKANESNLSSVEIRTFLRDYMQLANERPSLLHSMFLNFALNYSKNHPDFNFYNFFLLWNPKNLRLDDLYDNRNKEGSTIPSLISRICREIAISNVAVEIDEAIIRHIALPREQILDFFREPVFWTLYNAHKENRFSDLWKMFEEYCARYAKYGKSKWHSDILSLAERFMKENDEWRFWEFLQNWDPQCFMDGDWQEVARDGNTYKSLAIKSIKKTFDIIKTKGQDTDITWLFPLYEKAITLDAADEWLRREKALLHMRCKQIDAAIGIYRELVLELGDKHYIWQEFSSCFATDTRIKIGMLSKALSLEKNEDFLGEIRIDLARHLIRENLPGNAIIELETYKKHRELKGWRLSADFESLYEKCRSSQNGFTNNKSLYREYIPLAENFAYSHIAWTDLVVINKWKDEKGREKAALSNGQSIHFTTGAHRFIILREAERGEVLKFRLHIQETDDEDLNYEYSWLGDVKFKNHKYIPLMAERTDKTPWSILETTFAVVDYVNKERNIIHALTHTNKEVFFPQTKEPLEAGSFIKARFYTKKVKEENRIELQDIQQVQKQEIIQHFQHKLAIIDSINDQKQVFHFVINQSLQGVIRYVETDIRPQEGDFIRLSYVTRTDKDKKLRLRILHVTPTDEKNNALKKNLTGNLKLKFKLRGQTFEMTELDNDEFEHAKADFAFVGDYYVPRYLLDKHNITSDCSVKATAIYSGEKWKIIYLEKIG
ncbi:DUF7017 domain-containing protein [Chitinophaga sp. YR627]|uniref:DUF7017 domain-containing protein n=1 Tax=Chitinophaga sp. YR627 TaxID=1881041 RepID=UPI0011603195|nr:hypothetical protein [Chitinophaga sp. YR627]